MSRPLDARKVKDVRPRRRASLDEFYGDQVLLELGYVGEPSTYRLRIERAGILAAEGKGPRAWLARFLRECRR